MSTNWEDFEGEDGVRVYFEPEPEPTTFTVVCGDDRIRHEPFTDLAEARQWAEWGHICTAGHTFHRDSK